MFAKLTKGLGKKLFSKIKVIHSDKAPKAIGPYVQATQFENQVWCSGALGLHPETGDLVSEDVAEQANQAMLNIRNILKETGCCLKNVVKMTILLEDMEDYQKVNEVYAGFFQEDQGFPARTCVSVKGLPKDAKVEIEAIAIVPEKI